MVDGWILAGDIGGTKTALGLFSPDNLEKSIAARNLPSANVSERYPSHEFSGLTPIVETFLKKNRSVLGDLPVLATFGVAGPVLGNRCETTNLPWVIEGDVLEKDFSWKPGTAHLVNDLVAMGWGINVVREAGGIHWLRQGSADGGGNAVLIAPGTGLGEALLEETRGTLRPWPSEGGHSDWAPVNPEQVKLLEYLWTRFDHASSERLLSGPGLINIYRFVCLEGPRPNLLDRALPEEHLPEHITQSALDGTDACARTALRLFSEILAQEAGNMALKALATGGVFLGGGIPVKILPFLTEPSFLEHMAEKGRYRPFLEQVPVGVLVREETPLLGAAYEALLRLKNKAEHASGIS
ncbi:MAG: glucokinase [Nitrospirae bacterium]|jgi:glucokinase|nr:glucokinase [Nitrospirota bacterium]